MVRDDDDTEDDSDAAGPIEDSGIGELLDDLHHDVYSNVRMSTTASESNYDHKHNIWLEVEGTSEQFAKLVRDSREPLYLNCTKFLS